MKFHFTPMREEFARAIVSGWKYEGEYALYNYNQSEKFMLDASNWGNSLFAVLDEQGCLAGELFLGFLDAQGEWVEPEDLQAGKLEGSILWIGFGMRPDLTGCGLGESFVSACAGFAAAFAWDRYGYPGEWIGLGVAKFNRRAIKVYERVGFEKFYESQGTINGKLMETQRMKMKIPDRARAGEPQA